jgi:regulator of RNase E activity RraA
MTDSADIVRPPQAIIDALYQTSAATAAGELARLGVRNPHLVGLVSHTPGKKIVGPALTLQFMPKREDIHMVGEYQGVNRQLHRQVLYHTQPGDVVVVDARGDLTSGVFGEMMLTYFMGQGGVGVFIDGCIRDYPYAKDLGLGLWLKGVTPNFHTQTNIFPHAVNVPIACASVLVMPGDIIIADDDGAVVVPAALAPELAKKASEHSDWEEFTRMRLAQGGDLRKYYPLSDEARVEYEAWRQEHPLDERPLDGH